MLDKENLRQNESKVSLADNPKTMPNGGKYSENGGRHDMTIHYLYGKGRQIELDVNGIITKIDSLGEDNGHNQITVPVEIKSRIQHYSHG